jgi:hypothetical protein
VVLVGVQLLFGRNEPWLPAFIGRRGPHRLAMVKFRNKLDPWLARLERVVKPRAHVLLDHPVASAFTGLNLIVLGLLLSLPIPFTNVLFALLLLLFALGLLERDGRLLAVAWTASAGGNRGVRRAVGQLGIGGQALGRHGVLSAPAACGPGRARRYRSFWNSAIFIG